MLCVIATRTRRLCSDGCRGRQLARRTGGMPLAGHEAMRNAFVAVVMLATACADSDVTAPSRVTSMPWIDGFATTATSDASSVGVTNRMAQWQPCKAPCGYEGTELQTSLPTRGPPDTVLVSYAQGVIVLDHAGTLVGRAPGFAPTGSADEVLAIAAGDAQLGTPVLAISTCVGGRMESDVWLRLYRLSPSHRLDLLFAGIVERRRGEAVSTGAVTFVPQGLLYKSPGATTGDLWMFDNTVGRYVDRGAKTHEARPTWPTAVAVEPYLPR